MTEKFHQNDKTSFQKEVKKYYTPKNEKKLFFKPSVSLSDDDDDDIVHPVSMSPRIPSLSVKDKFNIESGDILILILQRHANNSNTFKESICMLTI